MSILSVDLFKTPFNNHEYYAIPDTSILYFSSKIVTFFLKKIFDHLLFSILNLTIQPLYVCVLLGKYLNNRSLVLD